VKLSKLDIRSRLRAAFFMPALCVAALAAFLSIYPPSNGNAQFVDQSTFGGTSTGSANAQVISIANLRSHTAGVVLRFVPGFTNTGPATLNDGFGAVAIVRPSSIGNVALSGQELLTGELTCVTYNGTAYQLSCNVDMTKIGQTVEVRGSVAPRGTLIEDGSCVSQTTYAPLFSVIGTTYGTCSAGLFAVPDSRGTMFAANDNQGVNGAAGRITTAGSSCNAVSVGVLCGAQNRTLTAAQIPTITASGAALGVSVSVSGSISGSAATNAISLTPSGAAAVILSPSGAAQPTAVTGSFSGSGSGGTTSGPVTSSTNTGGAAHPVLNPILTGLRAIKT
jgi:microcystin-dependent protein